MVNWRRSWCQLLPSGVLRETLRSPRWSLVQTLKMGLTMKMKLLAGAASVAMASLLTMNAAQAGVISLNFENIAPYPNDNSVLIEDYYNGGTSSVGTSGPNYGVHFSSNAGVICLNTPGVICSNTLTGRSGPEFGRRRPGIPHRHGGDPRLRRGLLHGLLVRVCRTQYDGGQYPGLQRTRRNRDTAGQHHADFDAEHVLEHLRGCILPVRSGRRELLRCRQIGRIRGCRQLRGI